MCDDLLGTQSHHDGVWESAIIRVPKMRQEAKLAISLLQDVVEQKSGNVASQRMLIL